MPIVCSSVNINDSFVLNYHDDDDVYSKVQKSIGRTVYNDFNISNEGDLNFYYHQIEFYDGIGQSFHFLFLNFQGQNLNCLGLPSQTASSTQYGTKKKCLYYFTGRLFTGILLAPLPFRLAQEYEHHCLVTYFPKTSPFTKELCYQV